jgi:hypothetical protein
LLNILKSNLLAVLNLKPRLFINESSSEIKNDVHDEEAIYYIPEYFQTQILKLLLEGYFNGDLDAIVDD